MSFAQYPWENRVFRIDRECYLLFLGMDELDEKPFVRIGNSSWLSKDVLDVISHTVITESFTGNPLGEVSLAHHYKGLYLGEPRIVEVIKSFFDRFHLSEPEVVAYSDQEEREGRDHVYFYRSGNIVVHFDKIRLFDLFAREKADRHYNYYCSELLGVLKRNPLKWEAADLKGSGFFRTDNSLFFFHDAKLLGLKWDRNYFKKLARAGWDPDKLEGILVDLKPEEMEGDQSAGVMNFIKRGIAARNPMVFYSRDRSFSQKIEPLFDYVKSRSVPLDFQDISDQGRFQWRGIPGEIKDGIHTFELSPEMTLSLDGDGVLVIDGQEGESRWTLLKNVPSRIHWERADWEELDALYVSRVADQLIQSGLTGEADRFVRTLGPVVSGLVQAIGEGKSRLSQPLEKQMALLKRIVRSLGKEGGESIALLAWNGASLLDRAPDREAPLFKEAADLSALLTKQIPPPSGEPTGFLYSAEYYGRSCFYQPHKLTISPGDRTRAAEMGEALIKCDKREVEYFFAERERLKAIMAALGDGTLWENMKKAENRGAVPSAAEKKSPSPPTPAKDAAPASQDKAPPAHGGDGKNEKRRKIPWWILLLLLIGLLGYGGYKVVGKGRLFPGIDRGEPNGSAPGTSLPAGGENRSPDETAPPPEASDPDGNAPAAEGADGERVSSEDRGANGGEPSHDSGDAADGESQRTRPVRGDSPDNGSPEESRSPLSQSDSKVIPSDREGEDPQVVFRDDEETKVVKPFVPSEEFIESFTVKGIAVTMADIHLKANAIAVMNGYRDLGFHVVSGKDPTIIEPGLVLKIPGDMTYTVQEQDNIWYIAARLLESELREHTARFDALAQKYDSSPSEGQTVIREIEALKRESNCKNFIIMVENWLEKRSS